MVDPLWGGCGVCFGVGAVASCFLFCFLDGIMDPGSRSGRLFLPLFLARAKPGMATSVSWHGVFCTNYLLAVKIEGRAS